MNYTWGYIKNAILSKLDMQEQEASLQGLTSRFYIYANEVITQVSSSLKPKYKHAIFVITEENVNTELTMPSDFVSWGADMNYKIVNGRREEYFDTMYIGYNKLTFSECGVYHISYNARWFMFLKDMQDGVNLVDVPIDILECIPSYVAHQCYKIDDETKAAIFRQEYEMFLARLDDSQYMINRNVNIEGGW